LAFVFSPWWLFGILYFLCGLRLTERIYGSVILKGAVSSEMAFCLLFYISQVHIVIPTTGQEYEWQLLTKKQ